MKLSTENLTLFAIIFGIGFGVFAPEIALEQKVIGSLFLSLLKMLIVPLVFASIFLAIVNIGSVKELKGIGGKAFLYYFSTTALAVAVGIVIVNIINPGVGTTVNVAMGSAPEIKEFSFETFVLGFIPKNIFASLTNGSIIQIIVFTTLFAVFTLHISEEKQSPVKNFFVSVNEIMMEMAKFIIKLTPIGVFSIVSYVVADKGLSSLFSLWEYVLAVVFALAFHGAVVLPTILYLITKESPLKYFMQVREAPLLAFSTASSSATLPVSIEISQEKGGISKKNAGFILPLGATVNMDGTALYESIAVIFIANLVGIDLSIGQQVLIFLTATIASIGAAGIPGAGIVMMVMVLDSVGLPVEYISVILVVDRVLDMFRTSINVWGDLVGAKVLDKIMSSKN
jgi:Na+/H+-dicarboxylate symporter